MVNETEGGVCMNQIEAGDFKLQGKEEGRNGHWISELSVMDELERRRNRIGTILGNRSINQKE